MSTTLGPINLFEFETLAKERLPKEEYDYIAGGATDEISVDRNRRAYESWALRPRVLRNVSTLDLSTTVVGTKVNLPVLIARAADIREPIPKGKAPRTERLRLAGRSSPSAPIQMFHLKNWPRPPRAISGSSCIRLRTEK